MKAARDKHDVPIFEGNRVRLDQERSKTRLRTASGQISMMDGAGRAPTTSYRIGDGAAARGCAPGQRRKARYDVIWRRAASPPSYRYPTPYPIHNQAWSTEIDEGGALVLSARLGGERRRLRLRGGSGFWRQRRAVEALIRGEAHKGELALYRRDAEVMAKMVMWLPRKTPRGQQRKGTLRVRTTEDSFLAYHMEGSDRIHYLHADHVRRWVAEHRKRLERLADDTKAERRRPRKNMRGIQTQRNTWARKHRARMQTWAHEVSRVICGYAERQGAAIVLWDDRRRLYLPDAPYAAIVDKLRYKLAEAAIELEVASD